MNKQFNFTAAQSLDNNAITLSGGNAAAVAAPGVEGALDFLCALKCAGSTALSCLKCGTNLGCWATCAGPQVVSCISGCF